MYTAPRCKTRLQIALLSLLALAVPTAAWAQDAKPAAPRRLIRMESLAPRAAAPAAPKRDIFSPGGFLAPAESGPAVPGGRPSPGQPGAPVPGPGGQAEPETPPVPALNLRFIGFGFAPGAKRTVGLILLDGIAMAVAEGETLANGVKIVRVTRREIEAVGTDGKSLTFALEGAER